MKNSESLRMGFLGVAVVLLGMIDSSFAQDRGYYPPVYFCPLINTPGTSGIQEGATVEILPVSAGAFLCNSFSRASAEYSGENIVEGEILHISPSQESFPPESFCMIRALDDPYRTQHPRLQVMILSQRSSHGEGVTSVDATLEECRRID